MSTSDCWVVSHGDKHAGERFALLMPETELHEEGPNGEIVPFKPGLNATQHLFLELYQSQIQAVIDIADGAPVVLLDGGDLCHGNKYPGRLMSNRLSDQVFIAADCLRQWAVVPNLSAVRICLGTEAHNAGDGSLEHLVAEQVKDDLPDVRLSSHWRLEIGGALFDVAHHGPPPGSRYWLSANSLRWYVQDLVLRDEMELGERAPDVVLRFHYHTFVSAPFDYTYHKRTRHVYSYVHPAWCGMNPHAQKSTRSKATTHVGILMFHVVDGEIVEVVDRMVVWLDRRTKEVVNV